MHTVRKCDFDFLTQWFYPVFRKTIFTGQYLDRSIPRSHDRGIDQWTGEYPILLCLWSKCAAVIFSNRVTWCKLIWGIDRFTSQYVDRHIDRSTYWLVRMVFLNIISAPLVMRPSKLEILSCSKFCLLPFNVGTGKWLVILKLWDNI